jgi:YHS domain-containing protein
MWLRWLLIFLLIVFFLRFVGRLMRGLAEGMSSGGQSARRGGGRTPVKMVADPVCGTYVIPGKALQASRGRDTHYFCSESCRDKWVHS